MARQQEVDELFEIKNYFYIGNYQQCINETEKLKKVASPQTLVQRDIFAYRSYIAQKKYLVVLHEINESSPDEIQSLILLAKYLSSSKQIQEEIVNQIDKKLSGSANVQDDTFVIVAATIYLIEKNFEAAYRVLHTSESLEAHAFIIDILLKLDRLDLAKKKLKEMQEKDDDATLTQLAQAWIYIAMGGEKLQDAYYIYQELIDKYGSTPSLLNGQAVAFIGRGQHEEAESALQEALDKNERYANTFINLIVLSRHTSKSPEIINRYMSQLKDANDEHLYFKDLNQKESDFKKICQQYKSSVTSLPA